MCSWSLLYPIETVRSRVTAGIAPAGMGVPQILRAIVRTEGVGALYKGLGWSLAGGWVTWLLLVPQRFSWQYLKAQSRPSSRSISISSSLMHDVLMTTPRGSLPSSHALVSRPVPPVDRHLP